MYLVVGQTIVPCRVHAVCAPVDRFIMESVTYNITKVLFMFTILVIAVSAKVEVTEV